MESLSNVRHEYRNSSSSFYLKAVISRVAAELQWCYASHTVDVFVFLGPHSVRDLIQLRLLLSCM